MVISGDLSSAAIPTKLGPESSGSGNEDTSVGALLGFFNVSSCKLERLSLEDIKWCLRLLWGAGKALVLASQYLLWPRTCWLGSNIKQRYFASFTFH